VPLAALTDREINRAAVTWGAYAVAVIATMVAFTKPVAFVTTDDSGDLPVALAVDPLPQSLVLAAITLAAIGGRLRRCWGGALGPAVALAVLGGVLGGVGGMMLVDGYDSDAGGRLGPGRVHIAVAAGLAVLAMVLNARENLLRQNPWRRGATWWAIAIVCGPLVALILVGILTWGQGMVLTPVVLVGGGVVAGRRGQARWSGQAGL